MWSDRFFPFIRARMCAWSRNSSETRAPTYAVPPSCASDVAMFKRNTVKRFKVSEVRRSTVIMGKVITRDCITLQRMPEQGNGYGAEVGARVPTNHKSALEDLAWNRSTKHERYPVSQVVRDAVREYVNNHKGELSEEALDDMDEDLLANGGAGGGF